MRNLRFASGFSGNSWIPTVSKSVAAHLMILDIPSQLDCSSIKSTLSYGSNAVYSIDIDHPLPILKLECSHKGPMYYKPHAKVTL